MSGARKGSTKEKAINETTRRAVNGKTETKANPKEKVRQKLSEGFVEG